MQQEQESAKARRKRPRADESATAVEAEPPPYQSFGDWTKERSHFYATSGSRTRSGIWSSTGDFPGDETAPLLGTPAWQAQVVGLQAAAAAAASSSSSSVAAPDLSAEKTVFDSGQGKAADRKLPKPPAKGEKGGPVAISPHVVSPPSPTRPLALSPAGGFPSLSTALDEMLTATMMFYENH